MEIIKISSYTEYEKIKIAENYIIPNMMKKLGLKNNIFKLSTAAYKKQNPKENTSLL